MLETLSSIDDIHCKGSSFRIIQNEFKVGTKCTTSATCSLDVLPCKVFECSLLPHFPTQNINSAQHKKTVLISYHIPSQTEIKNQYQVTDLKQFLWPTLLLLVLCFALLLVRGLCSLEGGLAKKNQITN